MAMQAVVVKSYPTGDADVVNVRENSPESRKEKQLQEYTNSE